MYVMREDIEILYGDEVMDMFQKYQKKFGEAFICFNYVDFPGSETQRPAEMYREILREALKDDKPYHIVSHRFDIFPY